MKKIRSILVAVDGSDSSRSALRQAAGFAKKEDCKLTAVSVIPYYEGELELGMISNIEDAFKKPGERILSEAKEIAEKEGLGIDIVLKEGIIHEAIIEAAEENGCDLIVLGRRGLNKLERAFMGSVTARVIGYSPIDVLVMPNNSEIKWDKILLAIDGSKHSELATGKAIDMAQSYGGGINVISVVDVTDEFFAQAPAAVDEMIKAAQGVTSKACSMAGLAKISAGSVVLEGETHEKVIDVAEDAKADIICMGSHGRTGLRRLLMGSVTEKVIGHASCPVLVVKS